MAKPKRYLQTTVRIDGEEVGQFEAYIESQEGLGGYDEDGNYRSRRYYFEKIIKEKLSEYEDVGEGYDE